MLHLNTSEVSLKEHLRTMNLSFDDPSLDPLDSSLSLHDPSEIDTALLNDIDGERASVYSRSAGHRELCVCSLETNNVTYRWCCQTYTRVYNN